MNKLVFHLRNRDLLYSSIITLFCKLFKITPNEGLIRRRNHIYNRLKKKFYKNILVYTNNSKPDNEKNKLIWMVWLQNINNAPEIVKTCIKSVKNQMKDFTIKILDEKTIFDYISLPEIVIEKWKDGKIENAHFSDIVRFSLLSKYGGLWLDCTVFLTERLPSSIFNVPLFYYSYENDSSMSFGAWFIWSYKSNPIINETLKLLLEYWTNYDFATDYFVTSLLFRIVSEKNKSISDNIPCVCDRLAHDLAKNLNKEFSAENYNIILSHSYIHKLTYKNIDLNRKGTYYDFIVNNKTNE